MYTVVNPANVDQVWHLVAPWIAQAIGESDTWSDLDGIYEKLKQGFSRVWIGRDANEQIDVILVTETWFMDGRKILVLRWCAGKGIDTWLQDVSLVENLALTNGFHAIQIWGRPGWIKKMKPLGYKHEFTVLSKPLTRGLN